MPGVIVPERGYPPLSSVSESSIASERNEGLRLARPIGAYAEPSSSKTELLSRPRFREVGLGGPHRLSVRLKTLIGYPLALLGPVISGLTADNIDAWGPVCWTPGFKVDTVRKRFCTA
jgi:hypothetical protein